jgi:hypothetical protein
MNRRSAFLKDLEVDCVVDEKELVGVPRRSVRQIRQAMWYREGNKV